MLMHIVGQPQPWNSPPQMGSARPHPSDATAGAMLLLACLAAEFDKWVILVSVPADWAKIRISSFRVMGNSCKEAFGGGFS